MSFRQYWITFYLSKFSAMINFEKKRSCHLSAILFWIWCHLHLPVIYLEVQRQPVILRWLQDKKNEQSYKWQTHSHLIRKAQFKQIVMILIPLCDQVCKFLAILNLVNCRHSARVQKSKYCMFIEMIYKGTVTCQIWIRRYPLRNHSVINKITISVTTECPFQRSPNNWNVMRMRHDILICKLGKVPARDFRENLKSDWSKQSWTTIDSWTKITIQTKMFVNGFVIKSSQYTDSAGNSLNMYWRKKLGRKAENWFQTVTNFEETSFCGHQNSIMSPFSVSTPLFISRLCRGVILTLLTP